MKGTTRGYVTAGEAGLIVFLVGMAVLSIAVWADYGKRADAQYIYREPNMCVIRVEAPCGDDICRYKASVPCDELEALLKKQRKQGLRETN